MDGAKPIEPGCQAMVIRGIDAWKKVVYVGQFIGNPKMNSRERDIWTIDREINWVSVDNKQVVRLKLCPENALMRIDDPDNQQHIETEKHNDRKSSDKRKTGNTTRRPVDAGQ